MVKNRVTIKQCCRGLYILAALQQHLRSGNGNAAKVVLFAALQHLRRYEAELLLRNLCLIVIFDKVLREAYIEFIGAVGGHKLRPRAYIIVGHLTLKNLLE